jgi:hypothetical protein
MAGGCRCPGPKETASHVHQPDQRPPLLPYPALLVLGTRSGPLSPSAVSLTVLITKYKSVHPGKRGSPIRSLVDLILESSLQLVHFKPNPQPTLLPVAVEPCHILFIILLFFSLRAPRNER